MYVGRIEGEVKKAWGLFLAMVFKLTTTYLPLFGEELSKLEKSICVPWLASAFHALFHSHFIFQYSKSSNYGKMKNYVVLSDRGWVKFDQIFQINFMVRMTQEQKIRNQEHFYTYSVYIPI